MGVIKGEIKGNDTRGITNERATVHITGGNTLYFILTIYLSYIDILSVVSYF